METLTPPNERAQLPQLSLGNFRNWRRGCYSLGSRPAKFRTGDDSLKSQSHKSQPACEAKKRNPIKLALCDYRLHRDSASAGTMGRAA